MLSQKTRLSIVIFLFFSFFFVLQSAHANVSDIQFKSYTVADGLSQSTVTDIIEDDLGFIWFATTNGLNRFDGYDFKQFYSRPEDPHSLPNDFVRSLFKDSSGRLWVATYGGLARYIADEDRFRQYTPDNSNLVSRQMWTVSETQTGQLLLSDQYHVYEYDESTDDFAILTVELGDIPLEVRTIFDSDDIIWLGTSGHGVSVLDKKTNTALSLDQDNPFNLNIDAQFLFEIQIIDNHYWLATERGIYIVSQDLQLVSHYHSGNTKEMVSSNVRSIDVLDDGQVWLGTNEGLIITDSKFQNPTAIDKRNQTVTGLKDRKIIQVFIDSKKTVWIGTTSQGVHSYNANFSGIRNYLNIPHESATFSNTMIWSVKEKSDGKIWIATQSGGLNLFDRNSGVMQHFLGDKPFNIFDLELDANDNIWLATTEGLIVYTFSNNQFVQRAHFFKGDVIEVVDFISDKIWVWTHEKVLHAFEPDSFEKQKFEFLNRSINAATPLIIDENNNLWLSTNLGLALLNVKTNQYKQVIFNLQNTQPHFIAIKETSRFFWAATTNNGILKIEKDSYKLLEQIDITVNGKTPDFSTGLVDADSFWLASLQSIIRVSTQSWQVTTALPPALLEFDDLNEGAASLLSTGEIVLGGINGFHIVSPEKLNSFGKESGSTSIPQITGLKIFNREVTVGDKTDTLLKPAELSGTIYLKNEHSPFSIQFATVNSTAPELVQYRYKLNGFSDQWILTDAKNRLATFTNLMFGEYVFEVQSRYTGTEWSPSRKLKISIAPPIWLHSNALIVYAGLFCLLLTVAVRQYKSKLANQRAIKESEERLKLTLWSSGDELWDWDIYRSQVFRANTWGIIDFPQDDVRANSSYQANIHQDDIPRIQEALKDHLENDTDHFQVTYRAKTFKGEWIWLLDRGKVVERDNNNQPIRMTGTLKNISHLKQAEEQLKLFKRSIETISDGVFIADTNFRFISVNQAYCQRTGETREQALASYLKFHQYPDAFTEEVKKSLQQKGNWNGEVESRRTNGERYEIELNIDAIHSEDGKISHYVGVFSDITSRKSTEKELLKLANTDPLTDMPNRSFFQASHANLVRKSVSHALMCLDMDNFKKINDSMGHQTGDILIKQIGKRLQKVVGNDLTCYRLGGDEFSVLVDNTTDIHRITHLAQKILDELARPFIINKQEFVLGASVGIAFYPEDGNSPQEMLKNADTAMYFAKNAGGNKYQFFSGEMNQNAVRQLQIENLIRNGLKEDLFTVFYQPKVDITTGKLVSMEALVRFEHPEKGIVSPAQFIPLAEETGQILEIGEQVLRKACADTKRWVQEGLFTGRVAVNISARQFELPDLDDRIDKILKSVNLSPLHLECEITEGTLMQNPDQALRMMERLRERGIHLALDDFGTGYSSLAYLKKFPLNTLKIDKAFIDDIAKSNVDKHMAAAIINIAHNLGLKVVAEGVEEEEQLAILQRYECEMLQGYLYSKPLSSTRFERLLREGQQLGTLISEKASGIKFDS